jgi:L-fuconolactonase
MLPIIDTHQHLWELDRFELPWLEGLDALNHSYRMSDYLQATDGLNVTKTVYMEVDVAAHQKNAEADYITALCQQNDNPMAGGVLGGSLAHPDFAAYIRPFRDNTYIKGIRQVLHIPETPQGTCLTDDYTADVRLLGEHGLSFDLCMRPGELADAATLVSRCPDTRFIVDHCGNADPYVVSGASQADLSDAFGHTAEQWKKDVAALASHDNVVCKISGIVARAQPGWSATDMAPTVNYCLDTFGPDRVVFGGDWPVCTLGATYQKWATALRAIVAGRSEEDQQKLLYDNAARIYSLE